MFGSCGILLLSYTKIVICVNYVVRAKQMSKSHISPSYCHMSALDLSIGFTTI
jgi:hypothetical protein